MKTRIAVLCCGMLIAEPETTRALEGLEQLQKAALQDQAVECMVHEYARRYNEVLRAYSQRETTLTAATEETTHEEAMQWVESMWRYADQRTVTIVLESDAFKRSIETFRLSQHAQYPNLTIVH